MKTIYTKHLKIAIVLLLAFAANFAKAQTCTASFTPYVGTPSSGVNGQVTVVANVTGAPTPSATIYSWQFYGPSSSWITYTGTAAAMNTYSANGCYTIVLSTMSYSNSVPTCSAIAFNTVCINTLPTTTCNLNANFSYTSTSNGQVNFANTTSGNLASVAYQWHFGDGNSSTAISPSHTYSNNGVYMVFLVATNSVNPLCTDSTFQVITINTVPTPTPCNLNANFTHTTGANGICYFNNTTTSGSGTPTYTWTFGDGTSSTANSPSHTYTNNGVYLVTLLAQAPISINPPCVDTVAYSVTISNVTNCIANTTFSLMPTGAPHSWYAVVSNTGNVAAAEWYWGDSTANSFGIVTSHTYAAAGNYQICLTVTTTCGTIGTHCSSQYLNKTSGESADIIYINTVTPDMISVGINKLKVENLGLKVSPNPNTGEFNISANGINSSSVKVEVYNLIGEMIYETVNETSNGSINKNIDLNAPNGVYFIKVNAGDKMNTQKLIINK